jgi:hypothetical protein
VHWAQVLAVALVLEPVIHGNDGAASTAAGGIQLKREARISMEKERLAIGEKKITVEYEFLNETDGDITTEVAFPIPPYEAHLCCDPARPIDNLRIWVEGREITYQSEAKAMLRGVDYAPRLRQIGVDVVSLGHFDEPSADNPNFSRDFGRLSKQQQVELKRTGLFDEYFPQWTVELTHHWQQTFPAHKILHVRHEYTPVIGEMVTVLTDLTGTPPETRHGANFAQWCIDAPLRKNLAASMQRNGGSSVAKWVDYILTTANTWKKPIKQFELVVERPKPDASAKYYYVSFCWDGEVLQPDPDHFVARKTNFVPTRELSVGFFAREVTPP